MSSVLRQVSAWLAAFVLAVAIPLTAVPQAWAAEDSIDSWRANYVVREDGVLEVTEEIVFRFASSSARGIQRKLMTREPYDDQTDAVYDINVLDVSSPDAPAEYQTSNLGSGRERYLNIRIGDPNRTVGKATGTYRIQYQVTGAMRTFSGFDEFYWDALTDLDPVTNDIQLTVTVPGGVLDVNCYVGQARSTENCDSATIGQDGVATYTQQVKGADELITIAAKISPNLVSDNSPHLQPKADDEESSPAGSQTSWWQVGIVGAVTAAISGLFGWLFVRNRRDERFDGVPPGNVPPDPAHAQVSKDDGKAIIPVRFSPPNLPLAHAGYVQDGSLDPEDLSAVLVDMAVKGAIQLRMEPKGRRKQVIYVRPADPSRATQPYEQLLMEHLFFGNRVEVALSDPGDLNRAYRQLESMIAAETKKDGLMRRAASSAISSSGRFPVWPVIVTAFMGANLFMVFPAFVVIAAIVGLTIWLVLKLTRKGTRTALGRAYADQVEGFRQYISTAEADQLRFEEGEDIFSKYLPWAILFGEADRWTRVCRELIDMGRLAPSTPYWYYGYDYNMSMMRWSLFEDTLRAASSPEPVAPSSSGSGFGGGSSFSGGGFSGGGGGGGGTSSW